MRKTNLLGLKIIGITAGLLFVMFGLYWGGKVLTTRDDIQAPAEEEPRFSLADSQRDSDGDGMADFYETTYYRTDPNNADTDGDGVNDLKEVTSGRDPLTPGPNDVREIATGSKVTEQTTFTAQYLGQLPDDTSRDQILDQVKLAAFVEASRGELLPAITPDILTTTDESGKAAVSAYLDASSSTHNAALQAVTSTDLEAAFRLQIGSSNPEPMRLIVEALKKNITIIGALAVPVELVEMHSTLLAASMALRDNAILIQDIDNDFVGGLIGARNIEDLGAVFQDLAQQIQALEETYDLE